MRYQHRRRAGFTLVEMMVATALVLVIMLIISQAFASAAKTFSTMRSAGYMQERLRSGTGILRKDLGSDHFGPPFDSGRGGPNLSSQRLDQVGWQPPRAGYFELVQLQDLFTGTTSVREPTLAPGIDGEGLTSTRATRHSMRFTVRLPEGPATELFAARFSNYFTSDPRANAFINPQQILYTRWAEVVYFLSATTDPSGAGQPAAGGSGLPLWTLRRRIRLLPPENVDLGPMTVAQANPILADCAKYPDDVIQPYLVPTPDPAAVIVRFPGPEALNNRETPRILSAVHPTGDDLVITDVLSMEIKAAWFNNPTFEAMRQGSSPPSSPMYQPGQLYPTMMAANGPLFVAGGNMDEPFADLRPAVLDGTNASRFDTGTRTDLIDWDSPNQSDAGFGFLGTPGNPIPTRINIRALQIKLRVWDSRAEQTRQSTMIVEM
jgi:prepilin-type N-terminal cleavage/methylation domain-containing protein